MRRCWLMGALMALAVPVHAQVRPLTAPWLATQALPSPGVAVAPGTQGLWLQWQLTPLLWAWNLRHDVGHWRVLVAEPPARVGGSLELHVSPDLFWLPGRSRWGVHTGVRSWWPLHMRGDYLAMSVGAHTLWWQGEWQPGVDAGVSVLFGVLGLQVAWQPWAQSWQFGMKVRYF